MQNGRIESFNGRLQDECLNANWPQNLADAGIKIAAWQRNATASGHTTAWVTVRRMGLPRPNGAAAAQKGVRSREPFQGDQRGHSVHPDHAGDTRQGNPHRAGNKGRRSQITYAWGFGGQYIFVVPDLELVVLATSSTSLGEDRMRTSECGLRYGYSKRGGSVIISSSGALDLLELAKDQLQ